MFRRRSTAAATAVDPAPPTEPVVGKGHATPRRRDAEAARRSNPLAPAGSKKEVTQAQRADRKVAMAGWAAGDERYLPARDRGPARRLVRDHVDGRYGVGDFFLVGFLVLFAVSTFAGRRYPALAVSAFYLSLLWILLVVVDSVLLGLRVRRQVAGRFGDDQTRGIVWYAVSRQLQLRSWRRPRPQVRRGRRRPRPDA